MKILVFGSLNIDLIFDVDHIALAGETISSHSMVKSAGGKGANQAAALAKAGMKVFMAGKIGNDGGFLPEKLNGYGADTSRVMRYDGMTGQAIIQLDKDGQNAILLHSGGNGAITHGEIENVIGGFDAGDLIVLQNEISGLKEIIELAHNKKMVICLNPSPYNEKIEELPLNMVNIFFVNEIEGAALAYSPQNCLLRDILDKLVLRFPAAEIILTAGEGGAFYGKGTYRARSEIVEVPVVDTTAAGDAFTGYYIAARVKQMPVPLALKTACKAAALTVSRRGAMDSIPYGDEVW
ncbi:MAG: ribokinase [Treponema sp.]|nr:ribokinase [Treponema sp.]